MKATKVKISDIQPGVVLRWTQSEDDDDRMSGDVCVTVGTSYYAYTSAWHAGACPGHLVGKTLVGLSDRPLQTNSSHEERVLGWLGTTSNVDNYALGKVRITRVQRRRDRNWEPRISYEAVVIETE
jgi:hypothetical protein